MSQKVKFHSRLAGEFAPVAAATYNRRALNTTKARRVAVAAILAGAIGIGFAPVLVRMSEVGPSATAFFRLLFALPFLWIWMSTQPRGPETRPSTAKDFLWLTVAGLFFTGDLALWHWSLQFTSVANSTLLTNFAPLFVTIGACFFLRERITRTFVAGMGIALAGAILLVGGRIEFRSNHWWGDALAVVTAAFYAGYLLTVKLLRVRFSSLTIMAWSGVVSCLTLFVVAALSQERLMPLTVRGWLAVGALGVVSHLAGQTLIAFALGHLPASFSSVTLLLQPLMATLLAWVVLDERLTLWQWAGGLVILSGIFIASRAPSPATR
jgi:drug/metabolite transporter (DMT)-like permease